jgi:lipopolysaccharide export system permease protein
VKILHKYVLKEHLGPFTFALTALTSILLLNYIAKQFGTLVGKGLPWQVIAEFFALSIPFTVALTLPMAVLVAILYAFSRLAADNEITALKASGVGMTTMLTPALFAAIGVTMVMLFFNDQILPRTNHELAVLQTDIAQKKPTFALREQVINEVSPGKFYLRANHIDKGSNWMREVTIYDMSDPTRRRTIYADSGTLAMANNRTDLLMTLYNGMMQDVPTANPAELQRLFFQTDAIRVKGVANQFSTTSADEGKGNREMSVCEMQRDVDKARQAYLTSQQILQSGIERARTLHIKLDPSLTEVKFLPKSQITLGGTYCSMLQSLGMSGPWIWAIARKPASQKLPAKTIQQQLQKPTVRILPPMQRAATQAQDPAVVQTPVVPAEVQRPPVRESTAPKSQLHKPLVADAPIKRSIPQATLPGSVPHPIPFPKHLPIQPRVPMGVSSKPGVFHHIPPNISPAIGRMLFQQAQEQTRQQAQATMPTGLVTERSRLADLQLSIDSDEVEIHKKFALAVACFLFVLLGAPIALRFPRAGVGLTIGVSLFVFALYYVGLIAGSSLGSRGIIPPWVSMWAPNVIFGVAGLILVGRMNKHGGSVRSGDKWGWLNIIPQWLRRRRVRGTDASQQPPAGA